MVAGVRWQSGPDTGAVGAVWVWTTCSALICDLRTLLHSTLNVLLPSHDGLVTLTEPTSEWVDWAAGSLGVPMSGVPPLSGRSSPPRYFFARGMSFSALNGMAELQDPALCISYSDVPEAPTGSTTCWSVRPRRLSRLRHSCNPSHLLSWLMSSSESPSVWARAVFLGVQMLLPEPEQSLQCKMQ